MINYLTEAAICAGNEALKILPQASISVRKNYEDFATTADIRSQEIIKSILSKHLPDVPLIAEEDNPVGDIRYKNFITIDPFDGTIIGSRGSPEWGVLISYIENNQVTASVMYQPAKDILVTSSFANGTKIISNKIEEKIKLKQDYNGEKLIVAFDINYLTTSRQLNSFMLPLLDTGKILVGKTSGAAINGAVDLLKGVVDIYINPCGGKIWDFAPAVCAIREAGGIAKRINSDTLEISDYDCSKLHTGVILARSELILKNIF